MKLYVCIRVFRLGWNTRICANRNTIRKIIKGLDPNNENLRLRYSLQTGHQSYLYNIRMLNIGDWKLDGVVSQIRH